jgi:hypothetical protein
MIQLLDLGRIYKYHKLRSLTNLLDQLYLVLVLEPKDLLNQHTNILKLVLDHMIPKSKVEK